MRDVCNVILLTLTGTLISFFLVLKTASLSRLFRFHAIRWLKMLSRNMRNELQLSFDEWHNVSHTSLFEAYCFRRFGFCSFKEWISESEMCTCWFRQTHSIVGSRWNAFCRVRSLRPPSNNFHYFEVHYGRRTFNFFINGILRFWVYELVN